MTQHIICPKCHRIFSIELEDEKFVNRELVKRPVQRPSFHMIQDPNPPFVMEEDIRYKYTYKCRHCGYEWSEIKTEDA